MIGNKGYDYNTPKIKSIYKIPLPSFGEEREGIVRVKSGFYAWGWELGTGGGFFLNCTGKFGVNP
jgi:hypothetical protein